MTPDLSELCLVTVSFGSENDLLQNFTELKRLTDHGAQIVIVSNSGPISENELRDTFDCVEAPGNVGFSRACNLGASQAKEETKYLIFFNPDAYITLELASSFLDSIKSSENFGAIVPTPSPVPRDVEEVKVVNYLEGVTDLRTRNIGACFILSQQLFEDIGRFDENFFLWWEDTDIRDKILATGKQIGQIEGAYLVHQGSHATSAHSEVLSRVAICSHGYFRLKWQGRVVYTLWLAGFIGLNTLRLLGQRKPELQRTETKVRITFGLYLMRHILNPRKQLSFDGKGFPWNPDLGNKILLARKKKSASRE